MGMPLASTMSVTDSGSASAAAELAADVDISTLSQEEARQLALQLSSQRGPIDGEIDSHVATLKANDATMTSPLIDPEGFPIASIDIVAVRTARARIIALRNDRERIEQQMRQLLDVALARKGDIPDRAHTTPANGISNGSFPSSSQSSTASTAFARIPGTNGALSMSVPVDHDANGESWAQVGGLTPFARVNSVSAASPASQADLRVDDQILRFGHLTAATAHRSEGRNDLANLPSAVREGVTIEVLVVRSDSSDHQTSLKRLQLTPSSTWGGRGLLGCHLLPL